MIRYCYTPVRMAKSKKMIISIAGEYTEEHKISFITDGKAKRYTHRGGGTARRFLTRLNIVLSYDPANVLVDVYPNDLKTCVHKSICTVMFIVALLIMSNKQKLKILFIGEQINSKAIKCPEFLRVMPDSRPGAGKLSDSPKASYTFRK